MSSRPVGALKTLQSLQGINFLNLVFWADKLWSEPECVHDCLLRPIVSWDQLFREYSVYRPRWDTSPAVFTTFVVLWR